MTSAIDHGERTRKAIDEIMARKDGAMTDNRPAELDSCEVVRLDGVEVQENGIIRDARGWIIGRAKRRDERLHMMTDNRATESLREGLTKNGIEWRSGLEGVTFVGDWCFVEYDNGKLAATCEPVLTPEQAIAATLGSEPPYDELLRCLENDWHIRASWDGLRKFWCIELTEEGVKNARAEHHVYEQRITGSGSDWAEIMCDAFDSLMATACDACTIDELERLDTYIMKVMSE